MEHQIRLDSKSHAQKDQEIRVLTDMLLRSRTVLDSERADKAKLSYLVAEYEEGKKEM
jgi:hypothetical protein